MTWQVVPLKAVAREVRQTVEPAAMAETVCHYSIPVFDETGEGRVESRDDIGSSKLALRGGEILVSKLNPRISRVLIAQKHQVPTVASTEFIALRPGPELDPRFAVYRLGSDTTRQFLDSATLSVTRSQQRVRPEVLLGNLIELPPLDEQRAIADYLDRETARIDALIAAKQSLVVAEEARFRSVQVRLLTGWTEVRAKYCCAEITVGVVVNPSTYFVDEGVPFIHGTDVLEGTINREGMKHLSETSNRLLAKSRVGTGDVVAMRVGYPGRAAVVPDDLDGSNCASVLIFRRSTKLNSTIVAELLNSPMGRGQIEALQYGAAQEVLNVADAVNIRLPVPPLTEQRAVAEALTSARKRRDDVATAIRRSTNLLQERRQALITAAVTGQLPIPVPV